MPMDPIEIGGLILGPVLFWGVYHWYKDQHKPEPFRNLLLTYFLGIAAGALGLHVYTFLEVLGLRYDAFELAATDRLALFIYAILVIGVLEEVVKFLPFWIVNTRLCHFDDPMDGIIYSSFIALGFASYENFFYLGYVSPMEGLARGFASPLVHILFSSIWGYACGRAVLDRRPLLPVALLSLGVAALAHGLYDFFTIGQSGWVRTGAIAVIMVVWLWRMRLIRRLQLSAARSAEDGEQSKDCN